jgi:hypothetical protein
VQAESSDRNCVAIGSGGLIDPIVEFGDLVTAGNARGYGRYCSFAVTFGTFHKSGRGIEIQWRSRMGWGLMAKGRTFLSGAPEVVPGNCYMGALNPLHKGNARSGIIIPHGRGDNSRHSQAASSNLQKLPRRQIALKKAFLLSWNCLSAPQNVSNTAAT